MSGLIDLKDVYVWGVDTHARAASLRQWFGHRRTMKSAKIPILQGVSLEAKPGDRIAIIGPNGCGKSSLMKVISGNYPIRQGTRRVEGTIVPLIEMGCGFELEMSGRRNIELSYAYRGKLREFSPEMEQKIIEFAELGEKIDLPFKTYSSGMQTRLAFSSAIFQDPDILLLDEIFATGDAGFVEKSHKMLLDKVDKVSIAVMVNHSPNEFTDLCNHYVLMNKGKIVNVGKRKEILHQYYTDILHISDKEVAA